MLDKDGGENKSKGKVDKGKGKDIKGKHKGKSKGDKGDKGKGTNKGKGKTIKTSMRVIANAARQPKAFPSGGARTGFIVHKKGGQTSS